MLESTTFVFGSWACTANGSGGFTSHLIASRSRRNGTRNKQWEEIGNLKVNAGTFVVFVFSALLLMQDENMNVTFYFEVLLNVNTRYCIWFEVVINGLKIFVSVLGWNDYSNKGLKIRPNLMDESFYTLEIWSNLMAHSEFGPSKNGLWCWCHHPRHLSC